MGDVPDVELIEDGEISVVIQGPLLPDQVEGAARCVASVRSMLPGAEVILSTWEGEDASGFASPVRVVQSPDPGAFLVRHERPNNLNRLQVSTWAGLQHVSRRYCLKFRTDLALADRRFLGIAARRAGCLFERPVTMSNASRRNGGLSMGAGARGAGGSSGTTPVNGASAVSAS